MRLKEFIPEARRNPDENLKIPINDLIIKYLDDSNDPDNAS